MPNWGRLRVTQVKTIGGGKDPFTSNHTMGVTGANSVLFGIEKLSLELLVNATKLLRVRRQLERPITVVIDASWLGIKSGNRDALSYTIDVLKLFLDRGFRLLIVFDPKIRYHTKIASIQRSGQRECARAKAYHAKIETMQITNELWQKKLQTSIRSAESQF